MIVDPDFLDHWRTRMVCDALGDPMAPMYILRLWAHCQERRSDTFTMPTRGLKAQCRYTGDADAFEAALVEAGFIERSGDELHVCGWAEKNASLLAAWENGAKGGRPRKQKQNPNETHGLPSENPVETQAKPTQNREEKSREDKNYPSLRSGEQRASRLPTDWALPEPWREWAEHERPELDLTRTAAAFADYWHGKAGKDGRKVDWAATWRNWVRNERSIPPSRASPQPKHAAAARAIFGAPQPEIIDV